VTAAAIAQGSYYLITGLWAIVHIESFQKITGPKIDLWLVKTVGLLLAVIGTGLLLAAYRQQLDPALILIAIGSAAALLIIELVYVAKRTISRIYLLDAAVEAGLIAWWAVAVL
jgi:energy-converting hydrogenase Eha subunit E